MKGGRKDTKLSKRVDGGRTKKFDENFFLHRDYFFLNILNTTGGILKYANAKDLLKIVVHKTDYEN